MLFQTKVSKAVKVMHLLMVMVELSSLQDLQIKLLSAGNLTLQFDPSCFG